MIKDSVLIYFTVALITLILSAEFLKICLPVY